MQGGGQRFRISTIVRLANDLAVGFVIVSPVRVASRRQLPLVHGASDIAPDDDLKVMALALRVEDGVGVERHPLQQLGFVKPVRIAEAVVERNPDAVHGGNSKQCGEESESHDIHRQSQTC